MANRVRVGRWARVSQPYLNQLEAGTRQSLSISTLQRFAKAPGVPVAKLLK
jgi:hypothetical protein